MTRIAPNTVPLGEVATFERTGVAPAGLPAETIYIGLEHIERGGRILGHETVGSAAPASTKFRFTPHHVLFGKLRPNLGKIARPNFAGICSTDIIPIRPGRHLDRGYLAHYLAQPSMIDFAASRATGANLPRLSPTVLATFAIPLPSLDEQRRIAAILDHADTLRTKRRQTLAHLDALPQAFFRNLSESATSTVALCEVAELFSGGTLPQGRAYEGQADGTLLMKVSDMNADGNEQAISRTALWTDAPTPQASTVVTGAVVLPKRGASIATNKKRLATRPTALDPNLMGVQPDEKAILPAYLYEWFRSFDLATLTSGSTVPQLNKGDLAPLRLQLPALEPQKQFNELFHRIKRQRDHVERANSLLGELFKSLRFHAFRGQQ